MTSVSDASPSVRHQVAEAVYGLGAMVVRRLPRQVSLTALSTMATLDRTGSRRITDLAVAQGVSQPSMTTLVAGLEREGYVERGGDPRDRRVAMVSLTPSGTAALRSRRQEATDSVVELVDRLSAADLELLAAAAPVLHRLRTLDEEERR